MTEGRNLHLEGPTLKPKQLSARKRSREPAYQEEEKLSFFFYFLFSSYSED